MITFDTISLSLSLFDYNFNNALDFIKDIEYFDISDNTKKDNNKHNFVYKLIDSYKYNVLGLENLFIFETLYNAKEKSSRALDFKIIINAKALKYDYLQNIHKNNYHIVADYILSHISNYVKITEKMFYNLNARTVDITKNIICDNYSSYQIKKTLNSVLVKNRTLKNSYILDDVLYLPQSRRNQLKMYNKNDDLLAISTNKKNSNFKEYATELAAAYKDIDILRPELRLNTANQIKAYCTNYKLDKNDNILFESLLDNNDNIIYNNFKKISKNINKLMLKMTDNTFDITNFNNIRQYNDYIASRSLYSIYKDDFDKLKKDIYTLSKDRTACYRNYKKKETLLKSYILNNVSTETYSLKDCYNDTVDKLKNIDKCCI